MKFTRNGEASLSKGQLPSGTTWSRTLPAYLTVRGCKSPPALIPQAANDHTWVRSELEICGFRAITKHDLKETMDLAAQGRIQPIADKIYSMEDVEQAF